ncbi:hypothetical protein K440DRAFT_614624 [Wilcoxina mikolae CBS 423.85]|nr:hypothetical protein K440DRAFT_614624 [Wilcoxina mikolae CBS 423.85]
MLKTKPLTQLLSQSISPNVSSALLFTPSGSLLATGSSPVAPDAKKARTNAALAANIWAAYDRVASINTIDSALSASASSRVAAVPSSPPSQPDVSNDEDGLKSLTLELSDYNMHIHLVAPRVLLCLIGPRLPTRHSSSRSSAHSHEADLRMTPPGSIPRSGAGSGGGGSAGPASTGTAAGGSVRAASTITGSGGSLGILKTQAQGLVSYLEKELKGYELPEGL